MLNRKTTFVEGYVQLLDTHTAIFLITRACKKKLLLCTVNIANIIATCSSICIKTILSLFVLA